MRQPPRTRADALLVAQGLATTPAKAQALIMAGVVFVETRRIDKAAELLAADTILRLKQKDHDFVSRGALKLQAALDAFALDPTDQICLDIGASTGGFTELLLRRGAKHVYAVDVGTNQLDWKLRQDTRVTVLEQTDARDLTPALIPQPPTFLTADISFAGLRHALPAALELVTPQATAVLLIKPQFELPRAQVPKGGVVTDAAARDAVCTTIQRWLESTMGWTTLGLIPSPITGAEGNQEYLLAACKAGTRNALPPVTTSPKA